MTGPEVRAAMKVEDVPKALVERMAAAICPNSRPEHTGVTYCIGCFKRAGEGLADVLPVIQAQALREAADEWQTGGWANVPRRADRVADRIGAAQYVCDWLRKRAARLTTTTERKT